MGHYFRTTLLIHSLVPIIRAPVLFKGQGGLNHFTRNTLIRAGCLASKETLMSGKLIFVIAALGFLSSVASALTITPSDFGASEQRYPTKADFDWIFGQFATAATVDTESVAANREKLRREALKRINSAEFGKD
jgi:hypothetical protein